MGWERIKTPKKWHPEEGEALQGVYGGHRVKQGEYGEYHEHFIRSDDGDTWFVTGTIAHSLFMSGTVLVGTRVRLTFLGDKEAGGGQYTYKDFDLEVWS